MTFQIKTDADVAKLNAADQIAYYKAYNAHLKAENELKASARAFGLKMGDKGNIVATNLPGTGRFPITLWAEGWDVVTSEDFRKTYLAFRDANKALLSTGKDDPRYTAERVAANKAAREAAKSTATTSAPVSAPVDAPALSADTTPRLSKTA